MSKIKILAARHGESVANTEGIYQGQTYDTGLSDLGKKQAFALASFLRTLSIDLIIASRLKRTRETAEKIADIKNLEVVFDDRILETNHGAWEGQSKTWIQENYPDIYRLWQEKPGETHFPDGESFTDTTKRVTDFVFNYPWKENNVLITHDNIIRIMLTMAEKKPLNSIWEYDLHPAAITEFEVEDGRLRVININDDSFLGDLKADLKNHAL